MCTSGNARRYGFLVATIAISMVAAEVVAAAQISDVKVTSVTDTTGTVDWTTDVNTDATINYGLDPSVGIVRDSNFDKRSHTLVIPNLDPSTQYYFRVLSTDADGNKTSTAGLTFTTKSNDKLLLRKIISDIKKIKDPDELVNLLKQVQNIEEDIIHAPTISGAPKVVVGIETAQVTWTSDKPSNSMVHLAPESSYSAGAANPYPTEQGNSREKVTNHKVSVVGLDPGTTYHFAVSSQDDGGLTGQSADETFTTKSVVPTITSLTITKLQETSATVNWTTGGVEARGLVSYTNTRTKVAKTAGVPAYTTKQSLTLSGLEFGTRYIVTVTATNHTGDEAVSKPLSFVTMRDVVPPTISKVTNESTLFPSEDTKIQTILSWVTDEPSTCQVFYIQGLVKSGGDGGDALPPETGAVTSHTQVIVGLAPAMVYKFWMRCDDPSHNGAQSEDYVLITPIKEKSIIDLILQNFQGTFGWVNKIGK